MSRDHVPEYLDTQAAVDAFLDSIASARQLALDTEGASFHRFVDRVYLLQLSTRERTAVIDPLPIGTPPGLGRLLEDRSVEVVFHDADYDLRLLRQDYGWKVTNVFDTRIAAQLAGIRAFGLAALLEQYFGVKLDKKHQRADWSMRPLTDGMLAYAAQDTIHLLGLRDRLENELKKLGRLEWAREEFARLEDVQWEPEDAAGAFMRVKGARDLSRRELALLRELVPWRDALARAVDKSTFRVVSNDVLLEIARQAPASRESLAGIKGMPRGIVERNGDEVLGLVARGLAVPDAELPRFPRAPRWDRDPDFDARVSRLKGVRDDAAQRLELDPGVLCSRERMEAVARRRPATREELLEMKELRRWQVEVLGDGFLKVLAQEPAPAAASAPAAPSSPRPGGGKSPGRGAAKQPPAARDDSPYKDA